MTGQKKDAMNCHEIWQDVFALEGDRFRALRDI